MGRILGLMLTFITISTAQSTRLPVENLYRAFFGHVTLLTGRGMALPEINPDHDFFVFYYRDHIGLSDRENILLTTVASNTDRLVKEQDERANDVIRQFHEKFWPARPVATLADLPPAPPELALLWSERQRLIRDAIQQLGSELSAATYVNLDHYVHTSFSTHSQVTPVFLMPFIGTTILHRTAHVGSERESLND